MSEKKLQVIPLGGLGEFGMNCMALRYGDDIIVVDAGMMFPDTELMGVDIVTPDFAYLEQNAAHVRGLVLTHGHEDHIGGIPFLLAQISIPVYGTAFTLDTNSGHRQNTPCPSKAFMRVGFPRSGHMPKTTS